MTRGINTDDLGQIQSNTDKNCQCLRLLKSVPPRRHSSARQNTLTAPQPHCRTPAVIPAQARLHGCRAFGELSRAVVERRLEQAAEVVPIPLLWRGARQGGVVEPRLPVCSGRPQAGLEKAAKVVPIPLLWRGARQGGVVEPRLPVCSGRPQAGLEQRPRNPVVYIIHSRKAGMTTTLQPFQQLRISQITARLAFDACHECLFNPFGLIMPAYIAQQLYLVDII